MQKSELFADEEHVRATLISEHKGWIRVLGDDTIEPVFGKHLDAGYRYFNAATGQSIDLRQVTAHRTET